MHRRQFGTAGQRDDLVLLERPDLQPAVPSGLEGRFGGTRSRVLGRILCLAAQPAGPVRDDLSQSPRPTREVVEPSGMDLVRALAKHDFTIAVQDDPVVAHVVDQLLASGDSIFTRGRENDRIADGLDPNRLEIERGVLFLRMLRGLGRLRLGQFWGSRRDPIGKEDRQSPTVELIARPVRVQPPDVDLILEGGDFLDHIETERPSAANFYR